MGDPMGAHEASGREASTVCVRHAEATDGAQLIELSRACPMQGDVVLRIDRAPDFFALCRCRGEGFTLVALVGGAIVGCASVSRRAAYVFGEPTVMGYVCDVKVHPDHRHAGVAKRLLKEIVLGEGNREPTFYAGTTARGNGPVDNLLLRLGEKHPVAQVGSFVSFQLLTIPLGREDSSFAIWPAKDEDEDELSGLLDQAHRRYTFGPVFAGGGLRQILSRSPGMRMSDYLVARRAGRIVAALGIWDQSATKQTHVVRMTRSLKLLSAASRMGPALGLPVLPHEGQELRFRYVRHPAGEVPALAALLRRAAREARARGDHFLLFTCAEGDPLVRSVAHLPKTTYRYALVVGMNRPYKGHELDGLSRSLPFDDAALA
jgi:GNAT superfamily N-acetyltransferase